jgi:hypothetical protein
MEKIEENYEKFLLKYVFSEQTSPFIFCKKIAKEVSQIDNCMYLAQNSKAGKIMCKLLYLFILSDCSWVLSNLIYAKTQFIHQSEKKVKRTLTQSTKRFKTIFEDFFNNAIEDYQTNLSSSQKMLGGVEDVEKVIDLALQVKEMFVKNEFIVKNAFFQYCLKSAVGDKVKKAIEYVKTTNDYVKKFNKFVKGTDYEKIDKSLDDLDKVFNVEIDLKSLTKMMFSLTNNVTSVAETLSSQEDKETTSVFQKIQDFNLKNKIPSSQEELEDFIINAPEHLIENIQQFVNDQKSGTIIKQIFGNQQKFEILKADLNHESKRLLNISKSEVAEIKYHLHENIQYATDPFSMIPAGYPQPLIEFSSAQPYSTLQKQSASIYMSGNRVIVIMIYFICFIFIKLMYTGKKKKEAQRYLLTEGIAAIHSS